jgi:phage portal protein BeeE
MLHFDLDGNVFLMKERNGVGAVAGLWPIPPNWVMTTPTPSHRSYRVSYRGWQAEIPDTEILWIANPNPEMPYGRGVGMAQALADEVETDEYAAKFTRQFFLNSARPDFLVFPKTSAGAQPLGVPEVKRLEEEWRAEHMGFWRVAKPKFLRQEVGIHEFDQKLRDAQFVQLRQFERDLVRQTWGVPPEILGIIAPGASRATIVQASYVFARWVLLPRLEFFRSALQELLVPEYESPLILDFVSPVEADPELELEYARAAPWARTTNEWRAAQGLPPLAGPEGTSLALPLTTTLHPLGPLADVPSARLVDLRRRLLDERKGQ